jgi:hypothetical protein
MTEKEFIPYEQALALKELGFDKNCFGYYDIKDNNLKLFSNELVDASCNSDLKYDDFKHCTAPLYQQAFCFFREKHGLYSWTTMELGNKSTFCWVLSGEHTSTQYAAYFHTYEEAELECLIELIKITKTK